MAKHWFSNIPAMEKDKPASWKASLLAAKYLSGSVPLLKPITRAKAKLKYVQVLPTVDGRWFQKRFLVVITAELMRSHADRVALNQWAARLPVPFMLHSLRKRSDGRDRYVVSCTWHLDGTMFLSEPVSEGERITFTNTIKTKVAL